MCGYRTDGQQRSSGFAVFVVFVVPVAIKPSRSQARSTLATRRRI
jgi:hypothetical protein